MFNENFVVLGTPVDLDEVENPEEYISEGENIGLFWSEFGSGFGILGRRVAGGPNSNHEADHNEDLLSSYRNHKPEVHRKLEDHELIDKDFELSIYFVVSQL